MNKLLLLSVLFALLCIARSAPPSSSQDRTLILTDYDDDDETDIIPDEPKDSNEEVNTTTTTTTTTTATTRRSTYVFPTRTRSTVRRPWLTQRTTTVSEDEIDVTIVGGDENGPHYFRNIREFFKKLFDDVNKFFQRVTGVDIAKIIKQFFNRNKVE